MAKSQKPPDEGISETDSLLDQEDYLKVLYYGAQGTGKTTSLAMMAKYGRVVYVNAEGGLKKRPLQALGVPIENIVPVRCNTYDQLNELYWKMKLSLESDKSNKPIGICFDSYTEIQKQLVGDAVEFRIAKAQRAGKTNDSMLDPFFTDRDDYGRMTSQMRRLTRNFRDLPCHVGFSALEKRVVENDQVKLEPALTPAFCSDMKGYVDLICYTNVADLGPDADREEFLGVFRPIGKFQGKDRFGVTPVVMANPQFDRLIDLVEGKLDLETDAAQNMYADRKHAERVAATAGEISSDKTTEEGGEPDDEPEATGIENI